jgi:hypothetical protein
MAQEALINHSTIGDILVWEVAAEYCRESVTLAAPEDATDPTTFEVGYPVDLDGVPLEAADIADVEGITIQRITVPVEETRKVGVLARGPIVINGNGLPTKDYAGASINMTNFKNALAALGFVIRTEPTIQFTQET